METGYNWNPTLPSGSSGQLSNNGPYQTIYPSTPEGQKDFLLELFNGIKTCDNGKVIGDNVQRHFNILQNQINEHPSSDAPHPIPDDEYTHSFLRAGAAKILAVWLKHNNSANDLFIPMDPVFHNLVANKIYNESEFLPILIEAAEKALAAIQQTSKDNLRGG